MTRRAPSRRWLARTLPGILLVATVVDDPLFGGVIVAAGLAFGPSGLLTASVAFVVLSVAMAAATAWALGTEPLQLSARNRERVRSLQGKRFGRLLLPHPERPVVVALAAVIFGSVAPIIVAAVGTSEPNGFTTKMVVVSGVAYGLAFATGYGLLGAVVGVAA